MADWGGVMGIMVIMGIMGIMGIMVLRHGKLWSILVDHSLHGHQHGH
jgi:hypothetical protein